MAAIPDEVDSPSPMLTVEQVAGLLRVHPKTVYGAVKAGEIPGAVHVGRTIRIHGPTVLAWLAEGQKPVSRAKRAAK